MRITNVSFKGNIDSLKEAVYDTLDLRSERYSWLLKFFIGACVFAVVASIATGIEYKSLTAALISLVMCAILTCIAMSLLMSSQFGKVEICVDGLKTITVDMFDTVFSIEEEALSDIKGQSGDSWFKSFVGLYVSEMFVKNRQLLNIIVNEIPCCVEYDDNEEQLCITTGTGAFIMSVDDDLFDNITTAENSVLVVNMVSVSLRSKDKNLEKLKVERKYF